MRYNGRAYVPLGVVVWLLGFLFSLLFAITWTDGGEPIKALAWLVVAGVFAMLMLTEMN